MIKMITTYNNVLLTTLVVVLVAVIPSDLDLAVKPVITDRIVTVIKGVTFRRKNSTVEKTIHSE